MTIQEILSNLCYDDKRNPLKTTDSDIEPKENCFCDNCFRGKTELAEELLKVRLYGETLALTIDEFMPPQHPIRHSNSYLKLHP